MNSKLEQPTLASGASLARLAEILRFAAVLGNDDRSHSRASEPEGEKTGAAPGPPGADFAETVSELFRLLQDRGIRYVLVGGVALLRYVPGRNTDDIDLLLAVDELRALPEILLAERGEWFAKGRFRELRVDLLFTANSLFRTVLERYAAAQTFLELAVPCATPEGLILLKLYALPSLYRQGDLQRANLYEADVSALLLAAHPRMEALFEELSHHVSASDLAELRKITAEAQAREKRFGQSGSGSV
ncbi:MAG: hypothetical protein HY735_09975 [Verrucomicrobia bacterium]|nr:hypothetical protein [Verrucomicrobiota bacterium]